MSGDDQLVFFLFGLTILDYELVLQSVNKTSKFQLNVGDYIYFFLIFLFLQVYGLLSEAIEKMTTLFEEFHILKTASDKSSMI